MTSSPFHIRQATAADEAFILSLAPRLVAFALPAWRDTRSCLGGIRRDLEATLADDTGSDFLFVAEDAAGAAAGFLQLQRTEDFFTGKSNCHIANLAVAPGHEGRGLGGTLLQQAQTWAREHGCALITLAVFPGNARALALYRRAGFDIDLLRMARTVADPGTKKG